MLIQRAGTGTLPPPGFTVPPWAALAEKWASIPSPSTPHVTLGPTTLVMGHDDAECDDSEPGIPEDVRGHAFGWDNESPRREVQVDRFRAEWRPISNSGFYAFWIKVGRPDGMPGSWIEQNGQMLVSRPYFFSARRPETDRAFPGSYRLRPRPNVYRGKLARSRLIRSA